MSNIAILARGLSKLYRVGQFVGYKTLRESIANAFSASFHRLRRRGDARHEKDLPSHSPLSPASGHENFIWALKDVSFEVKHGEVVGIIGPNGAGKTTLLKILTRITEPTEGYAEIYGRVASLLEVGTGFHPELTGRENIYLNGAVLGMKRAEINRKFDEIVAFAEVEKFIDTPIKRYSSGMQVRLAFSVAAHLEPEILLVDEVLAVGDAAFQKKCLGKMGDVAKEGRTILFVSHNMAAILNFCTRTIVLNSGRIEYTGNTNHAIQNYMEIFNFGSRISLRDRVDRRGNGALRITDIFFLNCKGNEVGAYHTGDDVIVEIAYASSAQKPLRNVRVGLALDTVMGQRVTLLQNEMSGYFFQEIPPKGIIRCHIPQIPLVTGRYYFTISIAVNGIIADWIIQAGSLDIEGSDFFNTGRYPEIQDGVIVVQQNWSTRSQS